MSFEYDPAMMWNDGHAEYPDVDETLAEARRSHEQFCVDSSPDVLPPRSVEEIKELARELDVFIGQHTPPTIDSTATSIIAGIHTSKGTTQFLSRSVHEHNNAVSIRYRIYEDEDNYVSFWTRRKDTGIYFMYGGSICENGSRPPIQKRVERIDIFALVFEDFRTNCLLAPTSEQD
jgi:hypothetical protein